MFIRRLARHKHQKPYDTKVREEHDKLLTEYKKQCRHKRYKYFQETFNKLESNLSDPENFWKEFKNTNEKFTNKSKLPTSISSQVWKEHFRKLHTETRVGDVPEFPENKPIPFLNNGFQLEEINEIKKHLKKCKI